MDTLHFLGCLPANSLSASQEYSVHALSFLCFKVAWLILARARQTSRLFYRSVRGGRTRLPLILFICSVCTRIRWFDVHVGFYNHVEAWDFDGLSSQAIDYMMIYNYFHVACFREMVHASIPLLLSSG